MCKKIIFSIIVSLITVVAIIGLIKWRLDQSKIISLKCGDGICDEVEKANPNLCPKDCNTTQSNVNSAALLTTTSDALSPFGIHDPSDKPGDLALVGAKWVRYAGGSGMVWDKIENQKGVYDWSFQDQFYLETQKAGIKMFVSVLSTNNLYSQKKDNRGRPEEGHLPSDMNAYKTFLKKTVERYDGDGIDDAPGSPVVDVWQIENELDLGWKDSPAAYAELLKESYKTIKEANPKAKVAIAGVGMPSGFTGDNTIYPKILAALDKIKDKSDDRYFDIFDFHWYPFLSDYYYFSSDASGSKINFKDYVSAIKNILNKYGYLNAPIYITEYGQYSGNPDAFPAGNLNKLQTKSEEKQASDLFKEYIYGLANGVSKIFQVTLTEWYNFDGQKNGVFDNVGLINNPQNDGQSFKKLSYYTYKKMTETLEGSDWNNIQIIKDADKSHIYKFIKNNKSIWIAWNDNVDSKTITLSGLGSASVQIIEAIPKYASGQDVTDYKDAFNFENKNVNNGQVEITLSKKPIFIETE